jgi:hypothetical protein
MTTYTIGGDFSDAEQYTKVGSHSPSFCQHGLCGCRRPAATSDRQQQDDL